jgi:diguanylate cyclase (GGDEF)-like protein
VRPPVRRLIVAALALAACTGCAIRPDGSTTRSLAGLWAFQPGDDPAWARPGFDDHGWAKLRVPGTWRRQGFDQVVGLAWYRVTVPSAWPAGEMLGVTLGKIDSAYEVYVGGTKLGGIGALPPAPRMEYDRHRTYSIPPPARNADGSITIALRVWRNPAKISTSAGPVEGPFAIGPLVDLVEQEKLIEARELALVFIFVTVAVVHLSLRLRLGHGDEYLWFGAMAVLSAAYGFLRTQWKYLVLDDFVVLKRIEHVVLWLIPAVLLQFLWVFFGLPRPVWVRWLQRIMIGGAIVVGLAPSLLTALALLPIVQFSTLPITCGALALVVQRVRAGDREAPIVGFGMAVLSAAIVHDALVDRNLLVDPRVVQYGFAFLVIGMSLTLGNRFQRALRERDVLTRELEGRVEARTRELHEAYRRMEQLASYDELTQTLNRRAMIDRAQNELSRARRRHEPFALALVDLDSFKRINDSAGHAAGDAVLREIARRLAAAVRASDDVGRWGGEEFLVLLPGAAAPEAMRAGERLRAQIAASPIALPDGAPREVTISVGVVATDGRCPAAFDLDRLLDAADKALYRAKAEGRNAVRLSADPGTTPS